MTVEDVRSTARQDVGVAAVRIGVQGSAGWLGFDLTEVMAAVGPQPHLSWVMRDADFNGDVTAVWSADWQSVERQSRGPAGVPLDWSRMETLARVCGQIVDGDFTGYDGAGQAQVEFQVVDSSYWVVWARDDALLLRVRTAFSGVEDLDEHTPRPRNTLKG